ncbi:MAG: haloacid dehalogenase-like hydrolase [Elainella sp. Prado103]|jgi:phosphoserine phosphatase|nr:haloacid dehalogenase-like hydrolase [Elainella sp. Prado103]
MLNPLPSWYDIPTKQAILDFVTAVTTERHPDFVPPAERIATFDNDGTLWCERPLLIQIFFLIDRIKSMVAENPTLATQQPFKAIVEQDLETLKTFGKKELLILMFSSHTAMTPEEFAQIAQTWFKSATHPRFQRLFKHCVFQPMVELLQYLQSSGFKTFIVTGGGIEFVRSIAEEIYGIPPEQVIGSSSKTRFEWRDGQPNLIKLPELNSFDDREEKVKNIHLHIGRRPILAVGNSDGDLAMMQYAAAGSGRHLTLLLHHDDAEREDAYDRDFRLSPLTIALDEVPKLGGRVISMKQDFAQVFPPV